MDSKGVLKMGKYERQQKYDKTNITGIYLKFNKNTDKDILDFLEKSGNKQGTVKEALRKQIGGTKMKTNKLHINMVKVNDCWYKFELVNSDSIENQIVLTFIKDGDEIGKVHNIKDSSGSVVNTIAHLLNNDFAKKEAEDTIASLKKGKNNIFSMFESK